MTFRLVDTIFNFIFLILIIYVFLTWIPSINWYKQPFEFIKKFADFFFTPFRKIIPPIGMIDISPIVCFFFLAFLRWIVLTIILKLGI